MRDVSDDLEQWAIWSRSGAGPRLTYPHKAAFAIHTSKGYSIDDDRAERIDRAVAGLRESYPKEWEAIQLVYIQRMKYAKAAEKMRVHYRTLAQYIEGGRRFVEGAIYAKFPT